MNPFSSDKAPYAIALLISAIGWLLGGLHGSVQDSTIAAYHVRHIESRAVVTITNLSKKKPIGPVRFKVSCGAPENCFATTDGVADVGFGPGGLIDLPADLATLAEGSGERSVYVDSVLPPGASIDIVAQLARPGAAVRFQFVPNASKPEPLYIVQGSSPFAFFVAHYYLLMVTVSAVLAVLFGGWLTFQIFKPRPSAEEKKPDETRPPAAGRGAGSRRSGHGRTSDGEGRRPA